MLHSDSVGRRRLGSGLDFGRAMSVCSGGYLVHPLGDQVGDARRVRINSSPIADERKISS
jgi:hypothetical protein